MGALARITRHAESYKNSGQARLPASNDGFLALSERSARNPALIEGLTVF